VESFGFPNFNAETSLYAFSKNGKKVFEYVYRNKFVVRKII